MQKSQLLFKSLTKTKKVKISIYKNMMMTSMIFHHRNKTKDNKHRDKHRHSRRVAKLTHKNSYNHRQ
jgi:hypothetical protein